jgi:hypothetical protein
MHGQTITAFYQKEARKVILMLIMLLREVPADQLAVQTMTNQNPSQNPILNPAAADHPATPAINKNINFLYNPCLVCLN